MINVLALNDFTYGDLRAVLAPLWFKLIETPEFMAFSNEEHDALIVLPLEDMSHLVRPIHLAAARATVVGRGVTSPADFDRRFLLAIRQGGSSVSHGGANPSAVRTGKKANKRSTAAVSAGAEHRATS